MKTVYHGGEVMYTGSFMLTEQDKWNSLPPHSLAKQKTEFE